MDGSLINLEEKTKTYRTRNAGVTNLAQIALEAQSTLTLDVCAIRDACASICTRIWCAKVSFLIFYFILFLI